MKFTIEQLNLMDRHSFMEAVGWVVEHSPWVMERVYAKLPYRDGDQLHDELVDVIRNLNEEEKVSLLRSHPDLGTRLAMTDASVSEQRGAGLDSLSEDEYIQLSELNKQYTDRFGFPFIMAVKGKNKAEITEAMQRRSENGRDEELQAALSEIGRITKFRLLERVGH
ncbi:2-oxo-4-hydroxy-4-carboxy-5-ureidoimidazoline decarboxylase [Paenibacillus kobensis]|uniref:2-oxo-4-hydroxy-4-carboxy-5-ureidoimidazoline decarboxylase n=1 Tax=Paenibacillus kobensis TaxID=59841 RepID=UPI000FD838D8|nr:2-oxo-4-hydroxy-4-carboxy-5-ureidoimidazoline decarboxylase [Paenibacillus kobensis]